MPDIPKFAVDRLRDRKAASAHPEADVLNAFSENALRESEHAQVFAHLSECAECRDVLALATQGKEEQVLEPDLAFVGRDVMVAASARPVPMLAQPRFRWATLRWGAAAACAVVVSAAVLMYRGSEPAGLKRVASDAQTPQDREMVADRLRAQGGSKESASREALDLRERQPQVESLKENSRIGGSFVMPQVATRPPDLPVASPGSKQYLKKSDSMAQASGTATHRDSAYADNDKAKRLDEPRLRERVAAYEAQNGALKNETATGQTENRTVPATVTADGKDQTGVRTADKAAATAVAGGAGAGAGNAPVAAPGPSDAVASAAAPAEQKAQAVLQKTAPAKLNDEVQSSSEQVVVAPKSALASARAENQAAGGLLVRGRQGAEWSVTPVGKIEHSPGAGEPTEIVPIDPNVEFLTVTAVGTSVWAGGKGGVLYNSPDSGARWIRVVPQDEKGRLSSDVRQIEFDDNQHGQIVAGKNEVWSTADGGKSWKRK